MYCHGNQKKANACREVYTSRMKVCIEEAATRKAVAMLEKEIHEREYVDSKDKQIEDSKKGQ